LLPGRPGENVAEELAILVEELGRQEPSASSELRGVAFAGVDLVALGMNLEKKLFAGGGWSCCGTCWQQQRMKDRYLRRRASVADASP